MSTTTYEPPQPNAALVVGPEDHLVISFQENFARRELDQLFDLLRKQYPAIASRILVLINGAQLAALPPADSALSAPRADSSAAPHSPPE